MFIKQLDFISPKVTFYYQGNLYHSSILSGILSIISIIIIIILAIYYLLEIIERKDPNSFSFTSFIEDAPMYEINTSSLFHFINIAQNGRYSFNEGIDFTMFRIIGAQIYYEAMMQLPSIKIIPHWLYGPCDNKTDTEGISHLIKYDFFGKCACIKKYYDTKTKAYYSVGDPNFVWPKIGHGTFHENSTLYSIVVDSCSEETIGEILGNNYHCRTGPEIGQFYANATGPRVFQLYFLSNLMNVLDYDNPNKKFIFRIESIFSSTQYSENSINFNPSILKTHKGLLWDEIKEDTSYSFDRNDVYIGDKEHINIFVAYTFFLKNIVNYYERNYKRIQDIVSDIGGIHKYITVVAVYINSLYSNYIFLSDTLTLLHSSIHVEKKRNEIKKSKRKLYSSTEDDKKNIKNNEKDIKKNEKSVIKSSERIKLEKLNYTNVNNSKIMNDNFKSNNKIINENIQPIIDLNNKKDNLDTNDNNIEKSDTKKRIEQKRSFCAFLIYIITCRRKYDYYTLYKHFRIKIISEEHLIKNHLNIYNLMKVTERKRLRKTNSFQLMDLIKLV